MDAVIAAMEIEPNARNVLLCHQFVTGAERSGSEEMSVGGLDDVSAQVFEAFDYVALGHIHKAQRLCGGRVRYCGAPLCYDFSEAGAQKAALLVELGEKGEMSVEPLPFAPLRAMRVLRGSFAEVSETVKAYPATDGWQTVDFKLEKEFRAGNTFTGGLFGLGCASPGGVYLKKVEFVKLEDYE